MKKTPKKEEQPPRGAADVQKNDDRLIDEDSKQEVRNTCDTKKGTFDGAEAIDGAETIDRAGAIDNTGTSDESDVHNGSASAFEGTENFRDDDDDDDFFGEREED